MLIDDDQSSQLTMPPQNSSPRDHPTENYFIAENIAFMREEISRYAGQEILMGGTLNAQNFVSSLTILARGTHNHVPAVIEDAIQYDIILHNHPSASLAPSPSDVYAAGVLSDHGVGFYIVSNDVSRVNIITPSRKASERYQKKPHLAAETALKFLQPSPKGGMITELPSYVPRPHQQKMLAAIVHAFNHNEIFVCEAPTGTGKSLAYLLPAYLWTYATRKKVVISTHTLLLQEQLSKKDVNLVKNLTRLHHIKVEVVKGRQNYLCQRKWLNFSHNHSSPSLIQHNDNQWFDQLAHWARTTKNGEFNELPPHPRLPSLRNDLACETDTCKHSHCRHHHENKCFYTNARLRFLEADILIVNHHTLIIDSMIKAKQGRHNATGLLPAFDYLIIDEAHRLEEVAMEQFGEKASRAQLLRTLATLLKPSPKGATAPTGTVITLRNKLTRFTQTKSSKNLPPTDLHDAHITQAAKLITQLNPLINDLLSELDAFLSQEHALFLAIYHYLQKTTPAPTPKPSSYTTFQKRVKPTTLNEQPHGPQLKITIANLLDYTHNLKKILSHITQLFTPLDTTLLEACDLQHTLTDFTAYLTRLTTWQTTFKTLIAPTENDDVKWLSAQVSPKGRFNITAHCAKIDIRKQLGQDCLAPMKTLILTSATLTVDKSFDFFKDSIGCSFFKAEDAARLHTQAIAPYFNYAHNCGFYHPPNLPEPNQNNIFHVTKDIILEAATFMHGRTLVLFTSFQAMAQTKKLLQSPLKTHGIHLMMQGDFERYKMIETLQRSPQTVLLGVDSFWEGIDLRGDHLSCLIITKLPFPNFKDPLTEARMEYLNRAGKSSFKEFSLPRAIIKYRQGFGRLIRGENERGIFILLDNRLHKKSYGKMFLRSLPPLNTLKGQSFTQCAKRFFN